jgi:NAD(P)-dependent dehydrogenase (short-subunit alcohol dehydrogenase family)
MHAFEGSVAVITGGASGLGFALAVEAQKRGCKLVIGDIREDALKDAARKLSSGGEVLTFKVDVSNADEVEALAAAAVDRFGKVNILFNNAGVFASGITWETSVEEYDWVIGVNQRSVIHGIRSFVPRMIAQGDPCHVVTISSGAGITVNPGFCTYSMTKHAVVALTEALYLDLTAQAIKNIGVTIAMPGMTQSGIMSPEKTTPGSLQPEVSNRKSNAVLGAL